MWLGGRGEIDVDGSIITGRIGSNNIHTKIVQYQFNHTIAWNLFGVVNDIILKFSAVLRFVADDL